MLYLHTNKPLLNLVLQLCNNPIQNQLDIRSKCSKLHLFIASWCHLFAIFTWWCYWLAKYSLCCQNLSYNIHVLLLHIRWHQLAVTNEFTTLCTDIQFCIGLLYSCSTRSSMMSLVCKSQHWNSSNPINLG